MTLGGNLELQLDLALALGVGDQLDARDLGISDLEDEYDARLIFGIQTAPKVPFTSAGLAPPIRPTKDLATSSAPWISTAPSSSAALSALSVTEGSRYMSNTA